MTIADKLTLLANTKEALRIKLGLPKSLPFSEYYKHSYPFDPTMLFAGGKQGAWYDPSDKSTLFQDVAGTIPVTKDGDPVGLMKDKSGNGNHARQSVSTARPIYKTDGILHWLNFDGVDDQIGFLGANVSYTDAIISMAAKGFLSSSTEIYFGHTNSPTNRIEYQKHSDNKLYLVVEGNDMPVLIASTGLITSPFVVTSRRCSDLVSLLFNSEPASISTQTQTVMGKFDVSIGKSSAYRTLVGKLNFYGGVIVLGGISDADNQSLHKHLAAKAGVTL